MSNKLEANLLDILDSIRKIVKFTEGIFSADELYDEVLIYDAVLMNFINIGEVVARLPESITSKYNKVPWSDIRAFRNLLAHNYHGVDATEVFLIIQNDLPQLDKYIRDTFVLPSSH